MKREDIRIGETYLIREWDDLVEEYGTYVDESDCLFVKTPAAPFPSKIRHLCGAIFTVEKIRNAYYESDKERNNPVTYLTSFQGVECVPDEPGCIHVITPEMIESIGKPLRYILEPTPESLLDFLLN